MKNLLLALLCPVLALACLTARAERNFPEQATRGNMKAFEYPAMKIGDNIGDKIFYLSPSSRIFNRQNLIIMPASLQIQAAPIMFTLDMRGDLSKVWLLSDEEAARHPLPKPPPKPQGR